MWIVRRRLLRSLCAMALTRTSMGVAAQSAPTIAAASDLKFALEEIAAMFRRDTRQSVRLTFGSSGNFARQIEQGAPFALFMSADEEFVLRLAEHGLALDRGVLYAIGRIVIMAPLGSPLVPDGQMKGLATALRDGKIKRFAIANPEHAPYGRRAEEALRHAGLWDALRPHLVFGENIAQAAQFATSGSTQGGIIAYSIALAPQIAALGRFALIPSDWHQPLRQRMALLRGADAAARAFYEYLQREPARAVMRKYGFVLPGE